MLVHDIIKIKYVQLGYIKKNYPYHLISDEEMFSAFIDLGSEHTSSLVDPNVRFFDRYYPNPFDETDEYVKKDADGNIIYKANLYDAYNNLKSYIVSTINSYLKAFEVSGNAIHLPNWIYTYMLGEVVYQQSDYLDIQDTLALLGCSNIDNEFTKDACIACYKTSLDYTSTLATNTRPPTVFGEPHIIKSLRLGT